MIPKSAKAYKQLYDKQTGKSFFISSTIAKKFYELDRTLKKFDIDPFHYVEYSNAYWRLKYKLMVLPINVLTSDDYIEVYRSARHITNEEHLMGVMVYIEEVMSITSINILIKEIKNSAKFVSDWEELKNWRDTEFSAMFANMNYDEAVNRYNNVWKLAHLKSIEHAASYFKVEYQFPDLDYIAQQVMRVNNA